MSRPCFALSVMLCLLAASLLAIGSTNADEPNCPWSPDSSPAGWNGCADYSDCDYHKYECHTEVVADNVSDDAVLDEFFGADVAVTAPTTDAETAAVISDEELWAVFDAAAADAVPAISDAGEAIDGTCADIPWESILDSVEEYEFAPVAEPASSSAGSCDVEPTGDAAFDEAMGVIDAEVPPVAADPVSESRPPLAPTGLVVWAAERCQSSPDSAWLQDVVARAIGSAFQRPVAGQETSCDQWTCELPYAEQPVSEQQAGLLLVTAKTLDQMAGLLADAAASLRGLADQRLTLAKQPAEQR